MKSSLRDQWILFVTNVYVRKSKLFAQLPSPADAPHVEAAGSNPDRVLLVGSGIVAGTGVASHALGVGGHLAELISAATGRGVKIDLLPRPGLTIGAAWSALSGVDLSRYDAVVMAVGLNDALLFRSVSSWRRGMSELTSRVIGRMSRDTQLFVITIADPSLSFLFRPLPAHIAARHARKLNRETRRIADATAGLSLLSYHLEQVDLHSAGYATDSYRRWAEQLCPQLIHSLIAGHGVHARSESDVLAGSSRSA